MDEAYRFHHPGCDFSAGGINTCLCMQWVWMGYIHTDFVSEYGDFFRNDGSDFAGLPGDNAGSHKKRPFCGIYSSCQAGRFYRRQCSFISVPSAGRAEVFQTGFDADVCLLYRNRI